MGRRLNVSTPTVINTELVPLDESFYIDVDGQMEQWYYDNTEQYAPNRKVTPLLLVPVISAFDKDTSTSYTPSFNTTQWFANEWNESQGKYVETEITNRVDSGSADYVIQGNNLLVKKNVSYSHAVSIRCVATYIDPRDSGVTYAVESSVNLTTNRTADVVFPEVDIISPSGRAYNPLVDDTNSQYDFKGVTTNNPVQPLNTDVRRYGVDVDGTEEILNSGEAVAPIMDIRYGENLTSENQEFMYRQTAGGTLVGESIDKAYIERIKGNTVEWNQMLQNGNFNTIDGWGNAYYNSTLSISNNVLVGVSETGEFGVAHACSLIENHKHYVRYCINSDNGEFITYLRILGASNRDTQYGVGGVEKIIVRDILTNDGGDNGHIAIIATQINPGTSYYLSNVQVIDLTLIYGAGNEPSTVEQFEADYEKWFGKPLTYEEYDEGSLRPVLMQSIKTTGFNQWDEEWVNGYYRGTTGMYIQADGETCTKNPIPVIPGQTYFKKCETFNFVIFFDIEQGYIGSQEVVGNTTFTVPSNCFFIHVNFGSVVPNHDICINISNPSKNGTYEPYEEKVQGFDVTAIKGRLNDAGESVTIFPDGLKKAGNIQDEIFVEDGVVKAIKRVGSVDLGTLTWNIDDIFYASLPNDCVANSADGAQSVCAKYVCNPLQASTWANTDCWILVANQRYSSSRRFWLKDTSHQTSPTSSDNWLEGVMLYYELETPETYVLDPITDFVWYGIKNDQEVLADTLPWYVSGQGTDNLTVDAMYGENINVVLRCKMMDGETLSPSKAYATLSWRIPDIETLVQSDKGGAVRSSTNNMTFDTIVNVNGDVLSDALKQKHLAFNWKIRKNNVSTETDKGWGQRITIDASDLYNVKGSGSTLASTLVGNEVYLKGAYEEVTDNGEIVTDNGEIVYDRPIDE